MKMIKIDENNPENQLNQTYCTVSLAILKVSKLQCYSCMIQLIVQFLGILVGDNYSNILLNDKQLACEQDINFNSFGSVQEKLTMVLVYFYQIDTVIAKVLIAFIVFEWIVTIHVIRFQRNKSLEKITYLMLNNTTEQNHFHKREKRLKCLFILFMVSIFPLNELFSFKEMLTGKHTF